LNAASLAGMARVTPQRYHAPMRHDQIIVVGGTLNGERVVSDPLPANEAIRRFYAMRAQGYSLLTMTDAESGHDYDVGEFMSPSSGGKQ
jgi:hypothetical protein